MARDRGSGNAPGRGGCAWNRIVVGMTSIPTRIGKIRPAIESLLHGERVPDTIILSLPEKPLRGRAPWTLPDYLGDPTWHGGRLLLNWIGEDRGPGTKLLGALPFVEPDTLIVLADDDVRYDLTFISGIETAMRDAKRPAAFSYYTYRLNGLSVGQGCDGFAMMATAVAEAPRFFADHVADSDLVFLDDLWISHSLALKGIPVRTVPLPPGTPLIYEQVHEIDALRHLTDRLDRNRLNRVEAARLRRIAPIPLHRRAALALANRRSRATF